MAAATSIMRAEQIVSGAVEQALRPLGLTFARWELLMGDVVPACVQGGGILETEEGSWEITAEGADLYSQTVDRFRDGTFDAHRCFLWTAHFKRRLVPDYERWPEDRQRPADLYHDVLWHLSALAAA